MKIELTQDLWTRIHQYLDDSHERVVFLFVDDRGDRGVWSIVDDWFLDVDKNYRSRSEEHVVLESDVIPKAIKRAHDSGCAMLEIHGHYWPGTCTRLSYYDVEGLRELVPQILWRLPGRPYFAVVVGPDSFDALVWMSANSACTVDAIVVSGEVHTPTGLSLRLTEESAGE